MDQDGAVSIGQHDQCRERAMEADQFREDSENGRGADPTATSEEQRGQGDEPDAVRRPIVGSDDGPDDFRPGQADQPDREQSPGLTGTGPAQPID